MAELKQFRQLFDQSVQEEVNLTVEKMVKLVSDKYQIEKQELFDLLQEFYTNNEAELTELASTEGRELVVNSTKCLGKTKFGTQCSRSPQENSLFCGSHSSKLPYGRIDKETDEDHLAKKRGRPRKD